MVTYNNGIYNNFQYNTRGYNNQGWVGTYTQSNGEQIICGRTYNNQERNIWMSYNSESPKMSTLDKILCLLPSFLTAGIAALGIALANKTPDKINPNPTPKNEPQFKASDIKGITTPINEFDQAILEFKNTTGSTGAAPIICEDTFTDSVLALAICECANTELSVLEQVDDEQLNKGYENVLQELYTSDLTEQDLPTAEEFNVMNKTQKATILQKACKYIIARVDKHKEENKEIINNKLELLAQVANMKEKPEIKEDSDGLKYVELEDGTRISVTIVDGEIISIYITDGGDPPSADFWENSIYVSDGRYSGESTPGSDYNFDKIKEMAEAIFGPLTKPEE